MDNAELQKLRTTPGKLFPRFSPSVTEYSITVASSVAEVKLTVLTSESGASYCIKGDASGKVIPLVEGATVQTLIVVTAEDGTSTKTYSVAIRRLSSSDACLSQLELSAGSLQPPFSPLTFSYYCTLPCHLDCLTLRPKTEDPAMKTTFSNGSAMGTVSLGAGLTLIELLVTSVDGSNTATYTVNAMRKRCPFPVELSQKNSGADLRLECVACSGVLHCPCSVEGSPAYFYCWQCLEQLARINKADPMTGTALGEGWMKVEHGIEQELSAMAVVAHTPAGRTEGSMSKIASLVAQQCASQHSNQPDSATGSCSECSKKVPSVLLDVHQKLACSAKSSNSLPKMEVKQPAWLTRMVDDSLPSDLEAVLKQALHWEQQYTTIRQTGEGSAEVLEALNKAAACYATAIKQSGRDPRGHLGLGLVLEEMFYAEDMFGHKEVEGRGDGAEESIAERTSKEEEFLAICELHGVSAKAGLVAQLKAVEKEYQQLKEAGQSHKSEHVQQLYAWKSKQALQASKCTYSDHGEGPLKRAELKLQHALSVRPSDHASCYHLGRVKLLLGDTSEAEQLLVAAAAMRPSHEETALCLGLALSSPQSSSQFLYHGLLRYLDVKEREAEGDSQPQALHGRLFWTSTNILIGRALLTLATAGGYQSLDSQSCLVLTSRLFSESAGLAKGSTQRQLLWMLLQAKAKMLSRAQQQQQSCAVEQVRRLSALIAHCQLPSTEALMSLQMKVFQTGVSLQPGSSQALAHLGNGQLMQYEATGDPSWLSLAQLSFEASIECEGLPVSSKTAPLQVQQQDWWQKRALPAEATARLSTEKPLQRSVAKASTSSNPPAPRGKQVPVSRGKQATTATGKPVSSKAGAGRAIAPKGKPVAQTARARGVATLGEMKTGSEKPAGKMIEKEQSKSSALAASVVGQTDTSAAHGPPTDSPIVVEKNPVTHHARLGLARVLARHSSDGKPSDQCVTLYQAVIKMAPDVHDACIELGELLAKHDPVAAVSIYSKFPFSNPPTFDDAYLHGEIVRLLMASKSYDDPLLISSMVSLGQALGIAVLEKHVKVLELVFKTAVLKKVYAGVHGKGVDDPDMQAFFKFKCWM